MHLNLFKYFKNLSNVQKYTIIALICFLSTSLSLFFIFLSVPKQSYSSKNFNDALIDHQIKEITFSFNTPIISFKSFDDAVNEWTNKLQLSFNPPIDGVFRPTSNKELTFVLHSVLSNDLSISFNTNILKTSQMFINSDLVSNAPYILKKNEPKIIQTYRTNNDLKSPIFIQTTMPIRLIDLRKAITLSSNNSLNSFSLLYTIDTNISEFSYIETNYTLVKLIPRKLSPNSKYTIQIDESIFSSSEHIFQDSFSTFPNAQWIGFSNNSSSGQDDPLKNIYAGESLWLLHNTPLETSENSIEIEINPSISNIEYQIFPHGIKIDGDFQGNNTYDIIVTPKNLKDSFKQKITNIFSEKVTFKHAKPKISQPQGVLVIDKKAPIIPIQTINVTNMKVSYQIIKSDYYIALSMQGRSVPVITYNTNITISNTTPDQYQWFDFDASTLTSNESLLLNIKFTLPGQTNSPQSFSKVILTESVLSAYVSADTLLFYAQSIDDQKPIEDMRITVWDKVRGSFQDLGRTTAGGTLHVPNHKLPDPVIQDPVFLGIIESFDGDVSYAGIGSSSFISLDDKYFFSPSQLLWGDIFNSQKMKNMVFTDRSLYMPGEMVYFHILGRSKNNQKLTSNNPFFKQTVNIRIVSPSQQIISNFTKNWNEFGAITASFKLQENSESGFYSIQIENKAASFYRQIFFEVKPFEPKQSEILVIQNTNEYIYNDTFSLKIKPQLLFNKALNVPVSYKVTAVPTGFESKNFANYIFGGRSLYRSFENEYDKKKFFFINKTSTPNKKTGFIKLEKKLNPWGSYNTKLYVSTSATQPNLLPISNNSISANVYFPTQLGIKINKNTFYKLEDIAFDLIAVSAISDTVQNNIATKVKIIKKESIALGIFKFLTNYLPEISSYDKIITQQNLLLGQEKFIFSPSSYGDYEIKLSTKQFGIVTKTIASFSINDDLPLDEQLNIFANKQCYTAGDRAYLEIHNPFPRARLLLTVEQNMLREFYILESTNKIIEHTIAITSDDEPGINVSASLISLPKDPYSNTNLGDFGDIIANHIMLPVKPLSKEILIDINSIKSNYLPGEDISIDISAYSGGIQIDGQAVVIIKDKAVATYDNIPNPISEFYQPVPFSFSKWTSEKLFFDFKHLKERLQKNIATPLARASLLMNSSDRNVTSSSAVNKSIRSNILYTAFYNGEVPLYRNKKSTISFKLPDNISGFDVTVIAYDKDQLFGKTNTTFSTSKPFITEPIFPKFVRPNDVVFWGLLAHNLTDSALKATLTMNNIFSQTITNITLNANSSSEILSKSTISNSINNLWTIQGIANEYQDGFAKPVPIINYIPWIVNSYNGIINNTTTNINIPISQNSNIIRQKINIKMSTSPLLNSSQVMFNIITNNSLYLNQVLDKILLIIGNETLVTKYTSLENHQLQNIVEEAIESLILYSSPNGFNCFPIDAKISYSENPQLILKTYEALSLAQQYGYKINPKLFRQMSEFAIKYSQNKFPQNTKNNNVLRAYALKILALNKILSQNTFDSIYPTLSYQIDTQALILETMQLLGSPVRTIASQKSIVMKQITDKASVANMNQLSPIGMQSILPFLDSKENADKILQNLTLNSADEIRTYMIFEKKYPQSLNGALKVEIDQQQTILDQSKPNIIKYIDEQQTNLAIKLTGTAPLDTLFYEINYEQLFSSPEEINAGYTVTKKIYDKNNTVIEDNILKKGEKYTVALTIKINQLSQSWVELIIPLYGGISTTKQNYSILSPLGDRLYMFTQLKKDTTIKFEFIAQMDGTWTAAPISIANTKNQTVHSLIPQENITIK